MNNRVEALTSTGIPTGKIGVWWFLASEITVFGGLIASYIVVRLGSGGWSEAAAHVNFPLGLVNTFVLLTSSMTMVLAFAAVEQKNPKRLQANLLLTVLLGLTFLVIKGFEYAGEIAYGFIPGAGIFWSFYYAMTGLHALHVAPRERLVLDALGLGLRLRPRALEQVRRLVARRDGAHEQRTRDDRADRHRGRPEAERPETEPTDERQHHKESRFLLGAGRPLAGSHRFTFGIGMACSCRVL